jgi:hypothetical protein
VQVADPAVTVSTTAGEAIPLKLAVTLLDPAATPVANPPGLIVAVVVDDDAHETCDVMFCVLLSPYVPMAVSCCVAPAGIEGLVGVTAIELRDGADTGVKTISTA